MSETDSEYIVARSDDPNPGREYEANGYDACVKFVYGNDGGFEVINDYTMNIDELMKPIFARIARIEDGFSEEAECLRLLLDQCDYTRRACGLTDMVGACIPANVLDRCNKVLGR